MVKITELIDDFELSQQVQEWKKQYMLHFVGIVHLFHKTVLKGKNWTLLNDCK